MKQKSKAKKTAKRKKNSIPQEGWHRVVWLPAILTILVVPLIVRCVSYYNILAEYLWKDESALTQIDVFLIGKGKGIYLAAGLALFFTLCMLLLNRKISIHSKWMLLPAGYLFFALLSSILSVDRRIAFKGSQDLHQPFPVLAGYLVLFYYTYILVSGMKSMREDTIVRSHKVILRSLLVLAMSLSLIGILQLTGHDPFSWSSVRNICGLQHTEILDTGRIYMTLYHPDYVGMMIAMLIPMISIGISLEGRPLQYLYVLTDILLLICLWASKTRSGILAFLAIAIIALLLAGWHGFRTNHEKGAGKNAGIGVASLGILLILTCGILFSRNPLSERFFRFSEDTIYPRDGVTGIETGQEFARIRVADADYTLSWEDFLKPEWKDAAGDRINLEECAAEEKEAVSKRLEDKKIHFDMADYPVYCLESPENIYLIQIVLKNASDIPLKGYAIYDGREIWLITRDVDTGGYLMMNRDNKLTESVISEDALPDSFYGFASDRGYIWSKTIARLSSTVLYGTGPDTFPLYFPNNDYVARHLIREDSIIVNKPHNWYLQMAAETGCISAVMMIVFLIHFLWKTGRLEFTPGSLKKENQLITRQMGHSSIMGYGIGLSVLAYMIAALANDSMVVCAPVFWVILGYGCGMSAWSQN